MKRIVGYLSDVEVLDADDALVEIHGVPDDSIGTVLAAAIGAHPVCKRWFVEEPGELEDEEEEEENRDEGQAPSGIEDT